MEATPAQKGITLIVVVISGLLFIVGLFGTRMFSLMPHGSVAIFYAISIIGGGVFLLATTRFIYLLTKK